jgi:hypothetical protein
MYEDAESKIRGGLSFGARLVLGSFAALFGGLMLVMAPDSGVPLGFLSFGVFCLAIALACATRGRLRQFAGSSLAVGVLGISIWYLWSQVAGGTIVSGSRSQPSLLNAIFFFVAFGLPSASYLYFARFGFAKP